MFECEDLNQCIVAVVALGLENVDCDEKDSYLYFCNYIETSCDKVGNIPLHL